MKNMGRLSGFAAAALGAGLALSLLAGCEGGGGGSSGQSTVQGNVKNFSSQTAYFHPYRESVIAKISSAILDFAITPALADTTPAGVTVTLEGTDLVATTDSEGHFVITGVPAGSYVLVLTYNGVTASYPITVPDNATVKIDDIVVNNGTVTVREIEIEADDDDADDSDEIEDDEDEGDDDSDDDDDDDDDSDIDDDDDDDSNSGSGSSDSGHGSDD